MECHVELFRPCSAMSRQSTRALSTVRLFLRWTAVVTISVSNVFILSSNCANRSKCNPFSYSSCCSKTCLCSGFACFNCCCRCCLDSSKVMAITTCSLSNSARCEATLSSSFISFAMCCDNSSNLRLDIVVSTLPTFFKYKNSVGIF